ncbi:Hypothetical predicted protein [Mytilus galloprovincialis]|uniref:Chitin-binding type-2 domain-containing protein n=1 Tax=Mytilus galloprovincialis TaxID=29158 RepID=A0A8B6GK52_MYTGA|nr:Hypothetical predicted protein [Mytilus galloprovincialis]
MMTQENQTEAYQSKYYISCGVFGWVRCSRYRTSYRRESDRYCDGGWSSWSAIRWTTACSTTCDSGIKHGQRTRTCTNPIPVNGGKTCLGSSTIKVTDTCKDRDCPPVDGNWSDYTAVSWNDDCSTTCKCDYGIESGYKNRTCTNPKPAYGGNDCLGESFAIDIRQCTLKECPVDGGWGNYSLVQWSGICSTTCDFGTETGMKIRTCNNPKPAYGGEDCVGETNLTETRQCKLKDCSNNTSIIITCDHNGQYIPHPTDCHKFYQCVWSTPVEMNCPNSLAWNELVLTCDYKENVPLCNQLGSAGDSSGNTNTNITGEFECGDKTGFFTDPKNCITFYRCVHGHKYHMSCAAGTFFSEGACIAGKC